jgi:predicted secreted hydrolase
MIFSTIRLFFILFISLTLLLISCTPAAIPSAEVQVPDVASVNEEIPSGFLIADGSRPLTFPTDFGPHEDFRTEWWYYTGHLRTKSGHRYGFEVTFFRVGVERPTGDPTCPDRQDCLSSTLRRLETCRASRSR